MSTVQSDLLVGGVDGSTLTASGNVIADLITGLLNVVASFFISIGMFGITYLPQIIGLLIVIIFGKKAYNYIMQKISLR